MDGPDPKAKGPYLLVLRLDIVTHDTFVVFRLLKEGEALVAYVFAPYEYSMYGPELCAWDCVKAQRPHAKMMNQQTGSMANAVYELSRPGDDAALFLRWHLEPVLVHLLAAFLLFSGSCLLLF